MTVCGRGNDSVSGDQKERKGVGQGCQEHFPSVVVGVAVMEFVQMEKNFGNDDQLVEVVPRLAKFFLRQCRKM